MKKVMVVIVIVACIGAIVHVASAGYESITCGGTCDGVEVSEVGCIGCNPTCCLECKEEGSRAGCEFDGGGCNYL